MRMQHPREMAALLLRAQGWTPEDIDAAIEAGQTQTVTLDAPVPVYVYHHTAWMQDDGALVLQPDVYGWDAALLAAIDGARTQSDAALAAAETECALSEPAAGGAG
jgi:murein L,D-transpeptidase YcbB/YkuD